MKKERKWVKKTFNEIIDNFDQYREDQVSEILIIKKAKSFILQIGNLIIPGSKGE